ncbi:uncharacterized protein PADG_04233 [Paracoccidioides brasiliensis Pb18]|uniref:Uncharacterized protein n=1 Tax=Paracoccidioides brasiliensis (strain Pb18) TaxID=502780 RepID=C1GAE7_PARBD|nr:uncharacterized protein PADG_04233 [Paracoccidioides brasiliensis Pb18]EEH48149.1 hypothetical protein PADG_04233 [Paracoccidioides brasiliensis Pb18]
MSTTSLLSKRERVPSDSCIPPAPGVCGADRPEAVDLPVHPPERPWIMSLKPAPRRL